MREKLIRDRIPEQAAARGDVMPVRVADESEMMALLLAKVHEEAAELEGADSDSKRLEEFGDIVEVVLALGRELGVSGIYSCGLEKYRLLGGFKKRYVLRIADERQGEA